MNMMNHWICGTLLSDNPIQYTPKFFLFIWIMTIERGFCAMLRCHLVWNRGTTMFTLLLVRRSFTAAWSETSSFIGSSDHIGSFWESKTVWVFETVWFSVLTVLWTLRIMTCKNRNHCEGAIPLAVRDGDGEVGLSSTCFIPVALLLSLPGRGRPYWLVSAATFGVFFDTGKGSWTELRRRVRACGYAMLRQ